MRPFSLVTSRNWRFRQGRTKEQFPAIKELPVSRVGSCCRAVSRLPSTSPWCASFPVAVWRALSRSSKE